MSTPAELYNSMVAAARAESAAAAESAAQAQAQAAQQGLTSLTESIKQTAETTAKIDQRLAALEAAGAAHRPNPPAQGSNESNPLKAFEDLTGIPGNALQPVTSQFAREAAEKVFEERLGPMVREAEAVRNYQMQDPEFDINKMQTYLSKTPDVAAIVQEAASKGAYGAGIAYAETRRKLDEKIATEANGRVRKNKRDEFIGATRPDAMVVGGGGTSNPDGLNVKPAPLTADRIENAFAHLNAGNPQPFLDAFHKPNLPSEEEFQRMVMGPLA